MVLFHHLNHEFIPISLDNVNTGFSGLKIFKVTDIYRRLSLSQSPGDQTKYFELSVV